MQPNLGPKKSLKIDWKILPETTSTRRQNKAEPLGKMAATL